MEIKGDLIIRLTKKGLINNIDIAKLTVAIDNAVNDFGFSILQLGELNNMRISLNEEHEFTKKLIGGYCHGN